MPSPLLPLDVNPFPGIVFIDCEASSLNRPSYPIEVGLGWCDGRSAAHLVRPAEAWDEWEWNLGSAAVHNIHRPDLYRHGREVAWVAEWLNRELDGMVVCSDNPAWEAYWLGELFKQAGVRPRFMLEDADALVNAALVKSGRGMGAWESLRREVAADYPVTHRAGDDAVHWAVFFREAARPRAAA